MFSESFRREDEYKMTGAIKGQDFKCLFLTKSWAIKIYTLLHGVTKSYRALIVLHLKTSDGVCFRGEIYKDKLPT